MIFCYKLIYWNKKINIYLDERDNCFIIKISFSDKINTIIVTKMFFAIGNHFIAFFRKMHFIFTPEKVNIVAEKRVLSVQSIFEFLPPVCVHSTSFKC